MAPVSSILLRIPTVPTQHTKAYPAISPLRPELSQAGKTVLVAGGSTGIGFAIARSFVQAGASQVIILGRRENVLKDSVAKLEAEADKTATAVSSRVADIFDLEGNKKLWDSLKQDGIFVDVLVTNAATTGAFKPLLDAGVASTWRAFETNARTLLDFAIHLNEQESEVKRQKYFINISSSAIHNFETDAAEIPTYGLTKNAGTLVLQQIAKDTDRKDMQIINFHPGSYRTEMAIGAGYPEDACDWDDFDLAGNFAVWTATEEASFTHGRVIDAHWDVDELKSAETKKLIQSDPHFLKLGLGGIL